MSLSAPILRAGAMAVLYPRLVGVASAVWALRHLAATAEVPTSARLSWHVLTALWLVASGLLVSGRKVEGAAWSIAFLTVLDLLFAGWVRLEGLHLLLWIAIILALTERFPHERALLVRSSVSVTYFFAAITKLNPSWLQGEGIDRILQASAVAGSVVGRTPFAGLSLLAAIGVVVLELFLGGALWRRRLRSLALAIGVITHVGFILVLWTTESGIYQLVLLNYLLLVSYLAFWHPVTKGAREHLLADRLPTSDPQDPS